MKTHLSALIILIAIPVACSLLSCHETNVEEKDPLIILQEIEESDHLIMDLYPSYLREEYDKTIADVKAVADSSSCIILYACDLHFSYPGSGYAEKALLPPIVNLFLSIKKAEEDLHPNLIFLGGDYIQLPRLEEGQTKEMGFQVLDYINQWLDQYQSRHFLIAGNHEENYTGDRTGYGMTLDEFYASSQEKYVESRDISEVSDNHQVFFLDDQSSKIRFVFLNTTSPEYSSLKEGLQQTLKQTPSDYSVLVFNHFIGSDYNGLEPQPYQSVMNAMDWIKQSGVDFIGWIGAHNHADVCYVYNGKVGLSCLQSGLWTSGLSQDSIRYEHQLSTKDEIALSVLVINKKAGKIHIMRMGLGKDREINYNTQSGNVGLVKSIH